MIDPGLLQAFCEDMHTLGRVIDAPAVTMPQCGGLDGGGFRVDTSGGVYRLTYREKDEAELLAESPDRNVLMEAVFVQVTERMASEQRADSLSPPDGDPLITPPLSEIRRMAIELHADVSARQYELLARISEDWALRQAERNAARAQSIEEFFQP